MKLIVLNCTLLWNRRLEMNHNKLHFLQESTQYFFSEKRVIRILEIMNCPSSATFLRAQNKWGWMRSQVSDPTLGSKKLSQELWQIYPALPCTFFFFSYRKGEFLALITHYPLFWSPFVSPSNHWIQTILGAATTQKSANCWAKGAALGWPHLTCWTIPHPGVPLRKKLQVTIPGPNQLPCPAARSFRIRNKMPHWHWFRLKTFLNVYRLQPKFAEASWARRAEPRNF